jgi:hypothetical protein
MFNDEVNTDIEFGRLACLHSECRTAIPELMVIFNHSSQKRTLDYLCIQPEEMNDA